MSSTTLFLLPRRSDAQPKASFSTTTAPSAATISSKSNTTAPGTSSAETTVWTDDFCAEHCNSGCARCRDGGRSTGKTHGGNPCQCVLRSAARISAGVLALKRHLVTVPKNTLSSVSGSTIKRTAYRAAQGSDRTYQEPRWEDHVNYIADFQLILAKFLSHEQVQQWEMHMMSQLSWNDCASFFRVGKTEFFNEQYRIESIVGRELVERGMFPSHKYIYTRSVHATVMPGAEQVPYKPVHAPLRRALEIVATRNHRSPVTVMQPRAGVRFKVAEAA